MANRNKRTRNTDTTSTRSLSTRSGETNEGHDRDDSDDANARKKVRWHGKKAKGSTVTSASRTTATTTTAGSRNLGGEDDGREETHEVESESDEDNANGSKVCLAAMCTYGRIGAAYFSSSTNRLYVLEDTEETGHFDLAKMLLEQASPDIIFTSSKADDDFVTLLDEHAESTTSLFQIRPYKDFLWTNGRDKLLTLSRLSQLPPHHPSNGSLPPSSDPRTEHPGANLTERGLGSTRGGSVSNGSTSNTTAGDNDQQTERPQNAYEFMRSRRDVHGPGGDPTTAKWNASIRLANFACVDDAPLCLGSIGALLDYLAREKALMELDDEGVRGLDIDDIEVISLDQVMHINTDALMSLQVFENESHASVHSDKTKEGLSLFGILNMTQTTLGRVLLRTWLMRPSQSASVIYHRHNAVECFKDSDNVVVARQMHNHLKGFKHIPRVMRNMKAGKGKISDWQHLVKFSFHATMLRECLSELHGASRVDIIQRLIAAFDIESLKDMGIRVNEIVDWEESGFNDRVCVRPGIDEELDNKKYIYQGIDSVLSNVAETIAATVPIEFARSLNVVYFPQLGYLICVPMLDEWRQEPGIQPLEGWTFQFLSEEYVYFKSQEMYDMDRHIGDLHSTIVDRELEIIQALLEQTLGNYDMIMATCDISAELDCLLSFAEASRQYEYTRPQIVDQNVIDIVQGRHPLLERVVDTFVANDVRLVGGAGVGTSSEADGSGDHSILVCTGANACGKSVYLKQVALIQILAQARSSASLYAAHTQTFCQIGCFVPAQSATLGLVDKLFTRVSTRESVSKVQSAFLIDLAQVSLALHGAGLFCGVLHHLLHRGANCPKVLAATHFHDVFHEALLDPAGVPVSFCHMQILFTSRSGAILEPSSRATTPAGRCSTSLPTTTESGGATSVSSRMREVGPAEKITYLYRVAKGLSLDSHAAKCAEMFGVPTRIVERAEYVSQLVSAYELHLLLDEEMKEEERQDLEDAEAVCRRFLAWDIQGDIENDDEGCAKAKLARVLGREDE